MKSTMKVGVRILPRPEVLDTQGRAVGATLKQNGMALENCRVGKYIEIDVIASDKDEALGKVKKMAEYVLYNPLIETFTLENLEKK